jgi:hypothetical protein
MVCKRGIYHVRKRVPMGLVATMGKQEIWRSLKTDSEIEARRRSHAVLAQIESELAHARFASGVIVDETLLQPWERRSGLSQSTIGNLTCIRRDEPTLAETITVGELFDRFLADPTQNWSPRTRLAYETTQRLAVSIIGASTSMNMLSRAVCRDFLETLRFLPKGASRAFPALTPKEASMHAKATGYMNIISASNANTYLNKVCVVLNWAVREEFLIRNHLKGLRLADPIARMEKRRPFSDEQLEAIFTAPLFTGCQNDELGYAKRRDAKPKGSRFWVPLIALLSAGPNDVTNGASVIDGEGNVLREGSNGWTCIPETPGMGPMCNDATWMEALSALQTGQPFPTGKFGVSYMLAGEGDAPGVSNLDPAATEPTEDNMWIKDGPHMMIILPDPALYAEMSNDVSDPVYVMWRDTLFAHLMVRIAESDKE